MEILNLTDKNIQDEHICCAIADKKCGAGYQKKKDWLKKEFKNGYKFQKVNIRGKVFIEYVPIEHAWLPLDGKNFMVINCFWVSGQYKGKGNGKRLLQQCMDDAKAKGMDGIVAISSDKKRPFMSDPKFFKYQGFEIIDDAPPFFKLWGLKINPKAKFPKIKASAKKGKTPNDKGITAYYSDTCPFTDLWIGEMLGKYAASKNVPITIHHINSQKKAHRLPIPWVINSIFYNGELVTLEMKADRHLDKLIDNEDR